jgi:prevent-host-death family protein
MQAAVKMQKVKETAPPVPLTVPAGTFKAKCLSLMDQVCETKSEIIITKHRKPVAKLTPVGEPKPFLGRSSGMIEEHGDLVAPVAPDWEVDADL